MANYNTTSECGCTQNMSGHQMSPAPRMANTNNRQMQNMPEHRRTKCSSMANNCPCHSDPLSGMPIAMAYVPWQCFHDVYEPDKALQYGTIFPELNKPFYGKGGCPK